MSTIVALKLQRPCPHCGEDLTVLMKRDMVTDTGLMSAVVHGLLESLNPRLIEWHPVSGFEDAVRLPAPEVPW